MDKQLDTKVFGLLLEDVDASCRTFLLVANWLGPMLAPASASVGVASATTGGRLAPVTSSTEGVVAAGASCLGSMLSPSYGSVNVLSSSNASSPVSTPPSIVPARTYCSLCSLVIVINDSKQTTK